MNVRMALGLLLLLGLTGPLRAEDAAPGLEAPQAEDAPPEGGDAPSEGGDTPAEAGDTPAEGGDPPAEGGDTPAEVADPPAETGAETQEPPESAKRGPDELELLWGEAEPALLAALRTSCGDAALHAAIGALGRDEVARLGQEFGAAGTQALLQQLGLDGVARVLPLQLEGADFAELLGLSAGLSGGALTQRLGAPQERVREEGLRWFRYADGALACGLRGGRLERCRVTPEGLVWTERNQRFEEPLMLLEVRRSEAWVQLGRPDQTAYAEDRWLMPEGSLRLAYQGDQVTLLEWSYR